MKTLLLILTLAFPVHAELGLSGQAAWESSDTLVEGRISKWKKLADFSEDGPSDTNGVRTLYWAEVEVLRYLKSSGSKPKTIRVLWFENVVGPNDKSGPLRLDPLNAGKVVWAFHRLGECNVQEGVLYPQFIPLPKDISAEIIKHAAGLDK